MRTAGYGARGTRRPRLRRMRGRKWSPGAAPGRPFHPTAWVDATTMHRLERPSRVSGPASRLSTLSTTLSSYTPTVTGHPRRALTRARAPPPSARATPLPRSVARHAGVGELHVRELRLGGL